jgi:putative tryptophan/tyrosine transport system substrate-binding protein
MKLIRKSCLALAVTVISVSAFAEQPTPVSQPDQLGFAVDRLERVTSAFQGYVDSGQIPGAVVLIARQDKVAYFRTFGFRDREQKIAMTPDSIFRIASMTKPITSMRRREFIGLVGAAAVSWPLAARAQQPERVRRVGILMSTAETDPLEVASVDAFIAEFAKLGWVQGRNLDLSVRWGAADSKRMTANAAELVSLAADVLLAKGATVPSARQATTTIPIVFVTLPDPVVLPIVGSFSHPVGNITGFTTYENGLVGKRLSLLRDLSPRVSRVLYLRSRQSGVATQSLLERVIEDARAAGLSVEDAPAQNATDIEGAVQAFAGGPDGGLLVAFDALTLIYRLEIVKMAARYRLPAVYPSRGYAANGGLCCYGFNQDQQFREAASYVSRILSGAKPSDLPVQTPTKFELLLNLKTAKALDLVVSPSLLAAADEVVE